jgi:DNA-binding MarR family transcriptional regulator
MSDNVWSAPKRLLLLEQSTASGCHALRAGAIAAGGFAMSIANDTSTAKRASGRARQPAKAAGPVKPGTATVLDPATFDNLRHEEVRRQIARARNEYGEDFDAAPLTMLLLLHRVAAAFRSAESYELDAIGLTQTSFNILMVLHRSPGPVTMRELAVAVSVKPPNLTAAVRDLVEKKLIRRRDHASDKRSQMVEIAKRGETVLRPFLRQHFVFLESLFTGIDNAERAQFIRNLDAILTSITDEEAIRGLTPTVTAAATHARK